MVNDCQFCAVALVGDSDTLALHVCNCNVYTELVRSYEYAVTGASGVRCAS